MNLLIILRNISQMKYFYFSGVLNQTELLRHAHFLSAKNQIFTPMQMHLGNHHTTKNSRLLKERIQIPIQTQH